MTPTEDKDKPPTFAIDESILDDSKTIESQFITDVEHDPPIEIEVGTGIYQIIQKESDFEIKLSQEFLDDTAEQQKEGQLNTTKGVLGKRKLKRAKTEEEKSLLLTTKRDLKPLMEEINGKEEDDKTKIFENFMQLDERWGIFDTVPEILKPEGKEAGNLKGKRLSNKLGQISSMSLCIEKIIKSSEKEDKRLLLVDFCAGAGHSSLPLAHLYPNNLTVLILENKLRSLEVAKTRAEKSKLKNVICLQSNLEHLNAKFDIGIALHACGPATDMVLEKVKTAGADFVITPCCYGRIATLVKCSEVTSKEKFPKSNLLEEKLNINREQFCLLSRAADMDQAKGYEETARRCMRIVDWDRLLWMNDNDEVSYNIDLMRMFPDNCATKNHILVGCKKMKIDF